MSGATRRSLISAALATAVVGAVLMPLWSCGQTAGEAIQLRTGVIGTTSTGTDPRSFSNLRGWQVELAEAYAVIGPFYLYSEPPQASLLDRTIGLRQAYAHVLVNKGTVLGEMLHQYVVDLLSGEVNQTGVTSGQAGFCQSAELQLLPPGQLELAAGSHELDVLNGYTIWMSGTASKDGQTVEFEGGLTIPDEGKMRIVENISAAMDLQDAGDGIGGAVVAIFVDEWLGNVDFSSLPEPEEGDVRTMAEGCQAYTAWLTGVRSRYSYEARWSDSLQ